MPFLRSRKAWIGVAAIAAVVVAGLGVYLLQPRPHPAHVTAAPAVAVVGAKTVAKTATAEFLSVVTTTPKAGSSGVTVDSTITLGFNLPVDPAIVQSNLSVLPDTPGTFSPGGTDVSIVFTPSKSFAAGSSVSVVVRRGLTSRDGFVLRDDYNFSFLTQVSTDGVVFQAGNQLARVVNAQSGHPVNITVQLGNQVPPDVAVETFSAQSSDVLAALVHATNWQFAGGPIGTASMHLVNTSSAVTNNEVLTITEPDGIYLLLAADPQGQYGSAWVDFSKYGVLLRQDDQRIVVAGEDLTSGVTTPSFNITFYNLSGSVHALQSGSFSGVGDFPARYPSGIDVAVASTGGEDVVIPVSVPQTNADIKVVADLAQQPQIFLTTDRAGYQQGDTVKFAGVVRLSNDQLYTTPSGMSVDVWSGPSTSRLVSQTAAVALDGSFSGSFAIPTAVFNQDGSDAQLTLYVGVESSPNLLDYSPFSTVIGALGPHSPAGRIMVSLDKPAYVLGDTVVASISGTDNKGQPLANQALSLSVYSTQHQVAPKEMDFFPTASAWGVPVQQNISVQLDSSGHTVYSFSANVAQKAADQEVTVAARYGTGLTAALGAKSALVYQAADEVFLFASRTVYQPGDVVTAPFVVETRNGDRVPGITMAYEFDKTDYQGSNSITTVVASGTLSTDANGMGVIRATYSGATGGITLRIKGKDQSGSAFQDLKLLTVTSDPLSLGRFGVDTLVRLDATTDKIAYSVGDTASLTVTSSASQAVLLTLERGRIHQSRWVMLTSGDNPLSIAITPDLAPGFEVMFSYFQNGAYLTEGLPISVNNSSRLLKLTVSADKPSYTAGQTAHLSISVTDGTGAPVAATLLVDGYDGGMSAYKLIDAAPIARVFLSPAARGTNGSSSLVGVGDWGGRCGGGPNQEQPATTNPGQLAVWLTGVTADASGHASVDVPVMQGTVRVALIAAATSSAWGQVETDLKVQ